MATKAVKAKTKTYTITDENRVKNSPFSIAGTDIPFDIVSEFPIPLEAQTFDATGRAVNVRYIFGCPTIIKEEQINEWGYPANRRPTETERQMTTFLAGMLTVPEEYDVLQQYLEIVPWFKGKVGKRPVNTRILFEEYDQDKIDTDILETETLITQARMQVLNASRDGLVSLLRLANPVGFFDPNITINLLKRQALELADSMPDFVLKGMKTARESLVVQISKAIDYNVLNIDTAGKLLMQTRAGKMQTLATIPDIGGRHQKMERTIAFFEGEKGKDILPEVLTALKAFELQNFNDAEKDENNHSGDAGTGAGSKATDGKSVGPKSLSGGQQSLPTNTATTPPQAPVVNDVTTEQINEP